MRVMSATTAEHIRHVVDDVYRAESRRVFATLRRLLGDVDLAEDALHDAFAAAVEQWTRDGVPAHPRAWLVSAGRFTAIDALRRRVRGDAVLAARAASTALLLSTGPLTWRSRMTGCGCSAPAATPPWLLRRKWP